MRTVKFRQSRFLKWRYEIFVDENRVAISSNFLSINEVRQYYKQSYGRVPKYSEEIAYVDPMKNRFRANS